MIGRGVFWLAEFLIALFECAVVLIAYAVIVAWIHRWQVLCGALALLLVLK